MAIVEGSTPRTEAALSPRFAREVAGEVRKDRLIYGLILAYVSFAAITAAWVDVRPWVVAVYASAWLLGMAKVVAIWIVLVELAPAIRANPARPLAEVLRRVGRRVTPRLVAGSLLYMCLALFFGAFTFFKSALPLVQPFYADVPLADLDAWLHGGVDPWRWLHPLLGHHAITRALEWIYSPVWVLLLFAVPLLICSARRYAHLRRRFLLTLMGCWVVLGNLVALAAMSGGPIFYAKLTGDAARYADLLAYLEFSRPLSVSALGYSDYLWAWYERGVPGIGSGISAFPSIHVAMATLFCLVLRAIRPAATWIGIAFLCLILATSVHLAWHYAIDGYASMLGTLLIWTLLARLERKPGPRAFAVRRPVPDLGAK